MILSSSDRRREPSDRRAPSSSGNFIRLGVASARRVSDTSPMSTSERGFQVFRYAIVSDAAMPAAYLPANYAVIRRMDGVTLIGGEDRLGWSLDGYVIPRLRSGLYFAEECGPLAANLLAGQDAETYVSDAIGGEHA